MSEKSYSTSGMMKTVEKKSEGLSHSLGLRQIVMVGVGGTLGTGVFLGSGYVMQEAGPGGMIITYLLGGFVMWLMMMCVGELASAMPTPGQGQVYATVLIGPAMGFTCGWVNWLANAITVTAQIVASAIIMKDIIPSVNITVWIVLFTVLLFGVNALNAKQYGESAFWFSSLKLLLIIVFAIIGVGILIGVVDTGTTVGPKMIEENGGWFPAGFKGILITMMTAIFAYGGSDNFTVTAGELKDKKIMPRAVNTTTWVLIGSYLTVLIVLALTLPLGEADLLGSPFASVFELAGIKSAALIVNIIVLTSALSSGNYFVYASTRYLWSMSQYGQAPKFLSKVNKRKVPVTALVLCMIFAAFSIVASFVAEDTVYLFLMCLIGSANVLWYGTICICQFLFRRRYVRDGGDVKDLPYKTPLFPLVPVLGVLLYVGVFVGMVMDPTQTMSLAVSVPAYIVLFVGYTIYEKVRKNKNADGEENQTAN